MTAQEFKNMKPEYRNLEGNDLWNAMEDFMLRKQAGEEIIKQTKPFYKRYRLRWLFYRIKPNLIFGKNNYTADERCKKCKGGSSSSFGFILDGRMVLYCSHCGNELEKEKNTSIKHILYKKYKICCDLFWKCMDLLHIARSSYHGRYDMFGEERKYVKRYIINFETGKTKYELRKRKWWEYVFIEK